MVSEVSENLEYVIKFLKEHFTAYVEPNDDCIDVYFDSYWKFPEELMTDMINNMPDKSDYYIRCLSVEYGTMYHNLAYCSNETEGWIDV